MVIVYWKASHVMHPGQRSIARYDFESDFYPVYEEFDLSYWIVPGTLED